jgi:hypothetical protein
MMTTPRPVRAAAFAVLALLSACAVNGGRPGSPGGAPDPDRITLQEITASGGTTAYEVVQRVRPAWLRQQVDSRADGQDLQTLVIHNGTRYGFLGSLQDLPAEMIGSMRFMDGGEAQTVLTSNDREIGAVIQVFSRGVVAHQEMREGERRWGMFQGGSVSVFPFGYAPQEHSSAREEMLANGWTETRNTTASEQPLMAAVDIGVSGPLTVGVVGGRRSGEDAESYSREGGSVHWSHSSTIMAGVLGLRVGPLRIGGGPAMQVSTVTSSFGDCECQGKGTKTLYLRGGMAEGVVQLRVLRVLTGELRVQRYFLPERSIETFLHTPLLEISRMGWVVGVGGGLRVGR